MSKITATPIAIPTMAPVAKPAGAGAAVALGVTVAVAGGVTTTVVGWVTVAETMRACDSTTMPVLLASLLLLLPSDDGARICDGIAVLSGATICGARRRSAMRASGDFCC